MRKEEKKEYDACLRDIYDLIRRWEAMHPEEELIVMVLPIYDRDARRERIEQIGIMLLKENWDI